MLQQLSDSAPLGTVSPSNSPPPGPDPLPAPLRGSASRGFHAGRDIFAKSRSTWPRVQRARPLVQEMLRTRVHACVAYEPSARWGMRLVPDRSPPGPDRVACPP